MYKKEKSHRKAANSPKERDMPFGNLPDFQHGKPAKNDPVGKQEYSCNAYGQDRKLNWADRS